MIKQLLFLVLLIHATLAEGRGGGKGIKKGSSWLTLNGDEPVVVARGGFTGVAPDSSSGAFVIAQQTSLSSTIMLCDIQFTKDGEGFCLQDVNLANSTTIQDVFPKQEKVYNIDGKMVQGWFGFDYNAKELLENVNLVQNIYSRTFLMDGQFPLGTPFDIKDMEGSPRIWINVQRPTFYNLKKLNPALYIEDTMQDLQPAYISSPEIGFLKDLGRTVNKLKTKLILKFNGIEEVEPTTKEKYGALLKNLPIIKTYASGIMVPKEYIWPMDNARYLQPATTLVADAHKAGLEVFATGFANDNLLSYNYSYDPIKEYLQFIDNSQFSVDGVVSDFPATASEAIACLAQNPKPIRVSKTLVISHDGASGDYPGSSDLAYQKAIDDGVDIIDCNVQMSKDGVPFCSPKADISATTTAATAFLSRSSKVPEIKEKEGIYSFDLTWSEIQTLKPQLLSPYDAPLSRNPVNKNKGKLVTLAEFLELAKEKANTGVLINIENAPYLATKGLDIIDAITTALKNATFDKQSTQKVLIQSDDSSVLLKFKDFPNYQKVLEINKEFNGTTKDVAEEIKKYADAIRVFRDTIVINHPFPVFMSLNFSDLVTVMHEANISVYAGVLRNEFQNFIFDYYSDPYVELATLIQKGVDGVSTDFPATALAYMNSKCADPKANLPYTILPIIPGDMLANGVSAKPPKPAPIPTIQTQDLVDPPLPPVAKLSEPGNGSTTPTPTPPADATTAPKASKSTKLDGRVSLTIVTAMVVALSILRVH